MVLQGPADAPQLAVGEGAAKAHAGMLRDHRVEGAGRSVDEAGEIAPRTPVPKARRVLTVHPRPRGGGLGAMFFFTPAGATP